MSKTEGLNKKTRSARRTVVTELGRLSGLEGANTATNSISTLIGGVAYHRKKQPLKPQQHLYHLCRSAVFAGGTRMVSALLGGTAYTCSISPQKVMKTTPATLSDEDRSRRWRHPGRLVSLYPTSAVEAHMSVESADWQQASSRSF